jgi:hypothetical protein
MSCVLVLLVTIGVVCSCFGGTPALLLYLRGQGITRKVPESATIVVLVRLYP